MIKMASLIPNAKVFSFEHHSLMMSRWKFLKHLPKWILDLSEVLTSERWDAIVTYSPSFCTWLACFLPNSIVHLGGIPEERPKTLWRLIKLDWPLHRALKRARQVWFNDAPEVEAYSRKYCPKNSFLVSNSIDTDLFMPISFDMKETFKERMGLFSSFVIGIIGPFDSVYNMDGLIWLWGRRKHLPQGSKVLAIGDHGKLEMQEDPIVRFTGLLSDKKYVEALQTLDILIVPRFVKTYCPQGKVLEAMSCGIPVVMTDMATLPMGAEDGKHLFVTNVPHAFFDHGDFMHSIFMNRIDCLESSAALRARMGSEARDLIVKNYSFKTMKREIDLALSSL